MCHLKKGVSYKAIYADKNILRIIPFVLVIAIVALVYFFPQDDLRTLLVFLSLLIVFFIYKFDMRILVFVSLTLLVIGAILIARGLDDLTSRVAEISYWLLVTGVIGIVIDLFRKKIRVKQEN